MGAKGPVKRAAVKSLCLEASHLCGWAGDLVGGRWLDQPVASTLLRMVSDTLNLMNQPRARGGLVPTGP